MSEEARLLGGVQMAAAKARKAEVELERQVVRAHRLGFSLRGIATAAGFGSHHRVQEIVARAEPAAQQVDSSA